MSGPSWTDAAERFLLDSIDNKKKNNSIYIKKPDEIFPVLLKTLNPYFNSEEFTNLSRTAIEVKIASLWDQYRLPEYEGHECFEQLYIRGRDALDSSKLPQHLKKEASSRAKSAATSKKSRATQATTAAAKSQGVKYSDPQKRETASASDHDEGSFDGTLNRLRSSPIQTRSRLRRSPVAIVPHSSEGDVESTQPTRPMMVLKMPFAQTSLIKKKTADNPPPMAVQPSTKPNPELSVSAASNIIAPKSTLRTSDSVPKPEAGEKRKIRSEANASGDGPRPKRPKTDPTKHDLSSSKETEESSMALTPENAQIPAHLDYVITKKIQTPSSSSLTTKKRASTGMVEPSNLGSGSNENHHTGSSTSRLAILNQDSVAASVSQPSKPLLTSKSLPGEDIIMVDPPAEDDPTRVAATMKDLDYSITTVVSDLLRHLGLPQHQPLSLDVMVDYPQEVLKPMCSILGTNRADFQKKAREFMSSHYQRHVSLDSFLRAIIGKTVTDLCLIPNLQPRSFWSEPTTEAVAEGLRRVAGPKQIQLIKNSITEAYLVNTVKPTLLRRAASMASDVDQMLKFFIPKFSNEYDPRREIDKASDYTVPSQADAFNEEPEWHKSWMVGLNGIFMKALEWRLTSERSCRSEHSFLFPVFGRTYERKELTWLGKQNDDKIVDSKGKVLLGLMPKVTRKVRPSLTGAFGQSYPIYDGAVLAMPKNEAGEASGSG